jgi:uncharacterized membrane protein YfcA
MSNWYLLIVLGSVAGIVSGLLGLGSGTILIPGMIFIFSIPQKSAQGTALAVMVPMVLVGAIRYKLNPEVNVNMYHVLLIAVGAVAGAFLGTMLIRYAPTAVLRRVFGVFIIIVGLKMILSVPKPVGETVPLADSVREHEYAYEKENNHE